MALTFNQNGTVTYFTQVSKRAEERFIYICLPLWIALPMLQGGANVWLPFSRAQISKRLSAQHRRQLRMGESDLVDLDPEDIRMGESDLADLDPEVDVKEGLSAQDPRIGESDATDLDP